MLTRLIHLAAWAFVLGGTAPANAQNNANFQTWSAVIATGQPLEKAPSVATWFDGHVRRGAPGTTLIVRPGVGVKPTSWLSVWAGYAWVPNFADDGGGRTDEHRIWQQAILTGKLADGVLKLQSRTRFEQRFHETTPDVGFRLREFVRADLRPVPDSRWGLVVWDELFIGLNEPGFAPQGYDQNRLFVGPSLQTLDGLRLEVGYLWANLRRPPATLTQHVLAVNAFISY